MGYYTGAVFEISHPDFSGSVAGGGRYDKLVGKLSGTDAPACGFSIGFERIASLLLDQSAKAESERKNKVAVFVPQDLQVAADLMLHVRQLQQAGSVVSLFELPKNLKHSLERLKLAGYTSFGRYQTEQPLALKQIE
jgi:histidyl-tRNA synthetase